MSGVLGFVWNTELLAAYGWRFLDGLRVTLQVVGISASLGFLLAYPLCRARMSRSRLLWGPALAFITLFRGTPLLCQLYLVYYGAGQVRPFLQELGLWTVFRDAYPCCLLTFTLNTAAYQAQILRGGLLSVHRGQREAAASLGLSSYRTARHVVLPQALLVALPALGNELIALIKASALAAIVTILDLMGQTRFIFSRTFDFSAYLYAAIIYLAVTETIRRLVRLAENRLSRHLAVRESSPPLQAAARPSATVLPAGA